MDLKNCKTCSYCNFYLKAGNKEIPDDFKEDFRFAVQRDGWHPTLCLCEFKARVNISFCSNYHSKMNEFIQIWNPDAHYFTYRFDGLSYKIKEHYYV